MQPFLPENILNSAEEPGVYLMRDKAQKVIYIGKAKNLRARLKQYMLGQDTRPQVPYLLQHVLFFEVVIVLSEKEAYLLESSLIKQHQPKYNVLLKDDKSYIAIMCTEDPWPMLRLVRYRTKDKKGKNYFGPYTNTFYARGLVDTINKIYQLRQCSDEEFRKRTRPCILYQMQRCSAPCVGFVAEDVYKESVQGAKKLLQGNIQPIKKKIMQKIHQASEAMLFERAQELLNMLQTLERNKETKESTLTTKVDTDVWALETEGKRRVLTKLFWRSYTLQGALHFDCSNAIEDDNEVFVSFLLQYYSVNPIPSEVLLDRKISEQEILQELLNDQKERNVTLYTPLQGQKKKLCSLAVKNARAYLVQKKETAEAFEEILLDLEEFCKLEKYPEHIECFDNSHFAGDTPVSGMVVYKGGEKKRQLYRKYAIKHASGLDDYGMLREVLLRRYRSAKEEGVLPDLVIIDGGKGHLHTAQDVFEELEIASCELISLCKEEARHDKGLTKERIFSRIFPEGKNLEKDAKLLFFLQNIRDEAHRFSITYQKEKQQKKVRKSVLDAVSGIGPTKKKSLFKAFGSIEAMKKASLYELERVPSITKKDALALQEFFKKH